MAVIRWLTRHLLRLPSLPSPASEWSDYYAERDEAERLRARIYAQINEVNRRLDRLRESDG